MNTNMNPAPPEGPDQPAARQTGPVAKTVNYGIDITYSLIWGLLTVLCIAGLAAGVGWWALAGIALFGWFTYRNVRNIVVHRGRD